MTKHTLSTINASSTTSPKFSSNPAESPRGSATPPSGAASTPTTKKRYMNASSLNTLTNQEDKCSTSKMFSQPQELSSQAMMTSSYRSHPFNTVNPLTLENEGWNAAHTTSENPTMTNMLPGANVPATPPHLIAKCWKTKMHHPATKKNAQARVIDTHHHVSRQEWSNSKAPLAKTRTRSWMS